jgi:Ser/Thr protein kinase RdoA (MazF antagonist)
MLTPADAAIVARDPHLPGLATALDPVALAACIARVYPQADIRAVRPTYLRYKPAASCIAGFELHTGTGTTHGYLRAIPDDRWLERSTLVQNPAPALLDPGIVPLAGLCAELYILPNDAEVGGARRLLSDDTRDEVISRFVRKRPELLRAPLSIIRYKPERRLVARLGGDDGLIIKCYTEEGFTRAAAHAGDLSRTPSLHIPRLRGASVSRATLAWDWVAGDSLSDHLTHAGEPGPALHRLAQALASLHAQPARLSARYQPLMVASQTAIVASDLALLLPEIGPSAAALASELAAALATIDPIGAPLHGDLSPDQAILGPGKRTTIIDFDRAAAGHPAYDLATFAAKLLIAGNPRARELVRELALAYQSAAGIDLADALPTFTAAALLLLSTDPFRRRFPDWPQRTMAILAAASDLLSNARTAA